MDHRSCNAVAEQNVSLWVGGVQEKDRIRQNAAKLKVAQDPYALAPKIQQGEAYLENRLESHQENGTIPTKCIGL